MNKKLVRKIILSTATTALMVSVVSPFTVSASSVSVSSATYSQSTNPTVPVLPPLGGGATNNGGISEQGKITWSIKAIKAALRAGKGKIDSAIEKAVSYLPVSQAMKTKIVTVVKVEGLIKALDVVTDFSGSVEDALSQAIVYLGIPAWIADIIARAISAVLL